MCDGGYDDTRINIRDWRRPGGPWRTVPVDRCLARSVSGLNAAGIQTMGCCCGHRIAAGSIRVFDGQHLTVDSYGVIWRERPRAELREIEGRWWQELPGDPVYVFLGFAPTPRTPWRTFLHHLAHGVMMGYRLWPSLRFAWRHRRSFG